MIRRRLLTQGPSEPPGFDPHEVPETPTDCRLSHDDFGFQCQSVESADGRWTLAFGRRSDGEQSRWFRFRRDELVDTQVIDRPVDAAVANDGSAIVVSGSSPATVGASVHLLDSGQRQHSLSFDSNLSRPAISDDGEWAAVCSRPPAPTLSIFELRSGTERYNQTFRERSARLLGFHEEADGSVLYVGVRPTAEPYLGVDPEGAVLWESDRHWESRSLTDRVGSFAQSVRSFGHSR